MTTIEPKRAAVFIVSLFIVALLINSAQRRGYTAQNIRLSEAATVVSPQQQQLQLEQSAAAQKAADIVAEHARLLARYVNSSISKTPGSAALAFVAATQNGRADNTISTALVNHFKNSTVKIYPSFFKPEFVTDNQFAKVFDGATEILNQLDLAKSLDALLLARETLQFSKDPALDNLISANVQLEIQVVPVVGNVQSKSWSFTASGAGFSQTEAQANADERLLKQISKDTTMSVGL